MFANFTEETCTGTGATLVLAGATTGNIPFNKSFADGDPVAYVLEDSGGIIYVAGVGTYVAATDDITRADTWNWNGSVIDESPGTNITLGGGTHVVRCGPIDNQLIGLIPSNPEILGGDADGTLSISPSTANALGGNIVLYGDTHTTKARDIEFKASAGVELSYDDSASKWDFKANAVFFGGNVEINKSNAIMTINATNLSGDSVLIMTTNGGGAGEECKILFGDVADIDQARIVWSNDTGNLDFYTANTKRISIVSGVLTSTSAEVGFINDRTAASGNGYIEIDTPANRQAEIRLRHAGTIQGVVGLVDSDEGNGGDLFLGTDGGVANSYVTFARSSKNADFAGSVTVNKKLIVGDNTALTISGGVITTTGSYHRVDTEASAATDDLDTINGAVLGMRLILSSVDSARDITLKDGTGNLRLAGDFTLSANTSTIQLISNGTVWLELSRSSN